MLGHVESRQVRELGLKLWLVPQHVHVSSSDAILIDAWPEQFGSRLALNLPLAAASFSSINLDASMGVTNYPVGKFNCVFVITHE